MLIPAPSDPTEPHGDPQEPPSFTPSHQHPSGSSHLLGFPQPPVRINQRWQGPLSVPSDAHLEEVWGHLLLAQAALDMFRGTLGEGLWGETRLCHPRKMGWGHRARAGPHERGR